MHMLRFLAPTLALVGVVGIGAPVGASDRDREFVCRPRPIVIAHRGASGYRPEHTLEAYELAIDLGADFIEPDLVSTRDGVLIARHDNVLNLTTDVAARPAFSGRRTTKVVDGAVVANSWFSEDFTLAEIRTLRAIERIPAVRPDNTDFDGQFRVPTLQEVIDLVKRKECRTGRRIGLYPETKHPTYFDALGLSLEEPLVRTLHRNGYRHKSDPVFIQSFEVRNLKDLARMTNLSLVQLLWLEGQPYDAVAEGSTLDYDEMATPAGLRAISRYADGVGPEKTYFLIPRAPDGSLDVDNATNFVRDAHRANLLVHPYTFRAENVFLPTEFRIGADPLSIGDAEGEIQAFLALGIDGFFTDHADVGVAARNEFVGERDRGCGNRRR